MSPEHRILPQVEGDVMTFTQFLRDRQLPGVRSSYVPRIYALLGAEGGLIHRTGNRPGHNVYLVAVGGQEADVLAGKIEEIVLAIREESYPQRSEQIRLEFQTRILTFRDEERETVLSLKMAEQDLAGLAYSRFFEWSQSYNMAERLTTKALDRAMPYLQGKTGEFESLNHFQREVFNLIVLNLFRNEYKKIKKTNSQG